MQVGMQVKKTDEWHEQKAKLITVLAAGYSFYLYVWIQVCEWQENRLGCSSVNSSKAILIPKVNIKREDNNKEVEVL